MTKTERDELRANVQKHNKRAALTVEMPAVAVIALLDAADEKDAMAERVAALTEALRGVSNAAVCGVLLPDAELRDLVQHVGDLADNALLAGHS